MNATLFIGALIMLSGASATPAAEVSLGHWDADFKGK